jgi:ketosteroid isomerase-like protein
MYAFLPVALLALIANDPSSHAAPHELTEAERARVTSEVSDFLASYGELIEGGDSEAIRGLYVGDERFAWFTDGEQRYASADDVLAGLAALDGMQLSTEVSEVEVLALTPDLAHARTTFHTKILQGGAVVFEFGGVTTWLVEQSADGEWRALSGHVSTPKPR